MTDKDKQHRDRPGLIRVPSLQHSQDFTRSTVVLDLIILDELRTPPPRAH